MRGLARGPEIQEAADAGSGGAGCGLQEAGFGALHRGDGRRRGGLRRGTGRRSGLHEVGPVQQGGRSWIGGSGVDLAASLASLYWAGWLNW